MRIIGIDPGLRKTGWGVIEANGDSVCQVANGTCDTKASDSLALRLKTIFEKLTKIVNLYYPDQAAVENTFVNKDAVNTLKLGQARGICMLVPALAGLEVEEYAPNAIKKAVVGVGHATKDQIEYMIKAKLLLIQIPTNILSQEYILMQRVFLVIVVAQLLMILAIWLAFLPQEMEILMKLFQYP